jgi:hypothetical protein
MLRAPPRSGCIEQQEGHYHQRADQVMTRKSSSYQRVNVTRCIERLKKGKMIVGVQAKV